MAAEEARDESLLVVQAPISEPASPTEEVEEIRHERRVESAEAMAASNDDTVNSSGANQDPQDPEPKGGQRGGLSAGELEKRSSGSSAVPITKGEA